MEWALSVMWGGAVWLGTRARRQARWLRVAMATGLVTAMLTQEALLYADGLLTLQTGLPLHLCGLFGVLSVPMLWHAPDVLYELSAFLAAPAAGLTLLFPAVVDCSHPLLMRAAFAQLHALVALTPVYLHRVGKPLPMEPRRALVWGNGYLALIAAFNYAFDTNYLFLRAVPLGTPLEPLFARGEAYYVCALEMLCMLMFTWLAYGYRRIDRREALASRGVMGGGRG